MAGNAVPCVTCLELYPNKERSKRAPLKEAPNKYCYREKCHSRGLELGHIKGMQKRQAAGAGPSGSNSNGADGPTPMAMARDMYGGAASLVEIEEVYGFR